MMLFIFGCMADKIDTATEEVTEEESYPIDVAESCHPSLEGWSDSWYGIEVATLEEINKRRAEPADCRTQGTFEPAPPLEMDPHLQCSSRFHSLWMSENELLEHDSPGGDLGDDPWQRIANAGFTGAPTGENIAAGYATPRDVVQGWMDSDGHCSIIMSPMSTVAGVGYYNAQQGYIHYWTLNTGAY